MRLLKAVFLFCIVAIALAAAERPGLKSAISSLPKGKFRTIADESLVRFRTEPLWPNPNWVRLGPRLYRTNLAPGQAVANLGPEIEAAEPNYVVSVDVGAVAPASADSQTVTPAPATVTAVIVDSGIDGQIMAGQVNKGLSRSFVGLNPLVDKPGHGTNVVARTYSSLVSQGLEFVSYQVLLPSDAPSQAFGTLDALMAALTLLNDDTVWPAGQTFVVNISLGSYPGSELLKQVLGSLQKKSVVTMSAGNDGTAPPTIPCKFATQGFCVAGIEDTGYLASFSNYGAQANIAAPGRVGSGWGTSYSAPQVGAAAAKLLQRGNYSPALINRLIMLGCRTDAVLGSLIGDHGEQACTVDAAGGQAALERLQGIGLLQYSPAQIYAGNIVSLATTEDSGWLARFFPDWLPGFVPQLQLTDSLGNVTIANGWLDNKLQFVAPAPGDYQLQLVVGGALVNDPVAVQISERPRHMKKPPTFNFRVPDLAQ